jgi:hypothetical protein
MNGLAWQSPPPVRASGGRKSGVGMDFVAGLQERPGEWALYPTPVSSAYGAQFKARYRGVEITRRGRGDGKFDMYVRWIGES